MLTSVNVVEEISSDDTCAFNVVVVRVLTVDDEGKAKAVEDAVDVTLVVINFEEAAAADDSVVDCFLVVASGSVVESIVDEAAVDEATRTVSSMLS